MKNSFTISQDTAPKEALELPRGRLMVGELVADFSPENVVEAATSIMFQCEADSSEHTFFTQAGVIAHAANLCDWNSNPEYKPI